MKPGNMGSVACRRLRINAKGGQAATGDSTILTAADCRRPVVHSAARHPRVRPRPDRAPGRLTNRATRFDRPAVHRACPSRGDPGPKASARSRADAVSTSRLLHRAARATSLICNESVTWIRDWVAAGFPAPDRCRIAGTRSIRHNARAMNLQVGHHAPSRTLRSRRSIRL